MAMGGSDEIPGSSVVRGGKTLSGDVELDHGLLKGGVEMVPCRNLPDSIGTST